MIKKYIFIENLDFTLALSTTDPQQILEAVRKDSTSGVYFLDIDLGTELNGLQLAQKIRNYDNKGYIIFVTTHDELAFETFKYQVAALDFILKDQVNLRSSIIRVFEKIEQQLTINNSDSDLLAVKLSDQVIYLDLKLLEYVETLGDHKLLLHSLDSESLITGDLKKLVQRLPQNFFRAHKSFLVNLDYVKAIDKKKGIITFKNKDQCLISRRKIKELDNYQQTRIS
ncbi:response regulator transcription factor [Lactobacillus sp. DCY120]|uniref:Response regulator transcription factor n=1 Tax=Bombilactobacillus apium TaxID=2675299 RepID=A0A850R9T0_9LACO|nr:LytTR family DNA-binding domain-containing protein [Bombilactobacillus apium]NVY96146.1 response regulator transcription factor [Bombilactobacillus apium]